MGLRRWECQLEVKRRQTLIAEEAWCVNAIVNTQKITGTLLELEVVLGALI